MKYIGIDPGQTGAVTFHESIGSQHRIVDALNLPTMMEQVKGGCKIRKEPDFDEMLMICDRIRAFDPELIVLEQVWPMFKDSAMTAGGLMKWYGILRYAIHSMGYELHKQGQSVHENRQYILTPPGQWKRFKGYERWQLWGAGDDAKYVAIEMVRDIFPDDFESQIRPLRKGSSTRRNSPCHGRADAALIGLWGYHYVTGWAFDWVLPVSEEERIPESVLVEF